MPDKLILVPDHGMTEGATVRYNQEIADRTNWRYSGRVGFVYSDGYRVSVTWDCDSCEVTGNEYIQDLEFVEAPR